MIVPDAGRQVIGIDAQGRTSPGGSTVLANGTALPAGGTRAAAPDRHAPSFDAGRHLQDRRKARPADLSQPRARDKRKPGPGQPLQGVENRRTSRWWPRRAGNGKREGTALCRCPGSPGRKTTGEDLDCRGRESRREAGCLPEHSLELRPPVRPASAGQESCGQYSALPLR